MIFFFSAALFVNAALFIPQAVKIYTTKTAKEVSLFTFMGFLIIQFATVLHAFVIKDYILLFGYLLSMVTCGTVVILVLVYKN